MGDDWRNYLPDSDDEDEILSPSAEEARRKAEVP